ncbi:MAG: hypothetical protein CVV49_15680 [Spirochaetae bacterium HGW-Spirochaetae-5]|nr:MAG: hypothetical protein CVV49_15680 [Spirochaetae bacterium HGW-Spirochaetae-5]
MIPEFLNIRDMIKSSLPVLTIILCLILNPALLKSDTLILKNGTLLVGKVKNESVSGILFKNTYGAFNVKRGEISALYITKNYEEDIAVRKKLGMDFDLEEIKKNYAAGQKDLTEKEKTLIVKDKSIGREEKSKSEDMKFSGKLFVEGSGLASIGELKDSIPYGFAGFGGLETGEHYLNNSNRNYFIPWFRAEAGYVRFSGDDALLAGFTGGAGPLWMIPVSDDFRSNIRFAVEPGVSSFSVKYKDEKASTFTFTLHSILGYEYSFDYVSVFVNLRFMYVYDKDVLFNSAGISAGVSGKLW